MSTHRKPGTPASPDGARGQQPDHPRFIRPAPDDPVQRAALLRRLVPLGVNGTYIDATGREVRVPTATLELVSAAFEDSLPRGIGPALVCTPGRYHPELFGTLVPEDGGPVQAHGVVNTPGYHVLYTVRGVRRLVIATPEHLREPQRSWGWQVQLYAARSRDSWGIGDFRDLGQICRIAAQQGAQCVQVSPVHAIAPVSHPKDSPYSPASRHFLNLLHIAPGFAPGAERVNLSDLSARGRALNDERLIDRTASGRRCATSPTSSSVSSAATADGHSPGSPPGRPSPRTSTAPTGPTGPPNCTTPRASTWPATPTNMPTA